jgi:hypothetical protein
MLMDAAKQKGMTIMGFGGWLFEHFTDADNKGIDDVAKITKGQVGAVLKELGA